MDNTTTPITRGSGVFILQKELIVCLGNPIVSWDPILPCRADQGQIIAGLKIAHNSHLLRFQTVCKLDGRFCLG